MIKKRGNLLLIVIFILAIMPVFSANAVCDSAKNLLRISSPTNAHGAIFSDTSYSTLICFDDTTTINRNPGTCTLGNGLVLALSGTTNAHAEVPLATQSAAYTTKICASTSSGFGLVCRYTPSSCAAGERFIVALSGTTNAHLSTSNTDPAYPQKICCATSAIPDTCTPAGGNRQCSSSCTDQQVQDSSKLCPAGICCMPSTCAAAGHICVAGTCGPEYITDTNPSNTCASGSCCMPSSCKEAGHTCTLRTNGCEPGKVEDAVNSCGDSTNYMCCMNQPEATGSVHWEDMLGNVLTPASTQAKPLRKEDTVKLVWKDSPLAPNPATFKVYKIKVQPSFPDKEIGRDLLGTYSSPNFEALWTISQTDLDNAHRSGDSGTVSKYYFVPQDPSGKYLENLDDNFIYIDKDSPPINNPPFVKVISPENCGLFWKDQKIFFNMTAYDEDDELLLNWDFGDGSTSGWLPVSQGNVSHVFTSIGQKQIIVTAKDKRASNSLNSTSSVAIMVLNSAGSIASTATSEATAEEYTCAQIRTPKFRESLPGPQVRLSGAGSNVIKYWKETGAGDVCTKLKLKCSAGVCPTQASFDQCYSKQIQVQTPVQDYSSLNFKWDFKDGEIQQGLGKFEVFKTYLAPILHKVTLEVWGSPHSSFYSEFFTTSNRPVCNDQGTQWTTSTGVIDSSEDCYKANGLASNGINSRSDCCPIGYSCDHTDGKCKMGSTISLFCSDYNRSKEECISANRSGVGITTLNALNPVTSGPPFCSIIKDLGSGCLSYRLCNCQWDSVNNGCNWATAEYQRCEDNSYDTPIGQCSFSLNSQSACIGNIRTISWLSTWTTTNGAERPSYCQDSSRTIQCMTEAILGVSGWNIAIAAIIVVLLMILYYLFKKNPNKKTR